jgi:hypothetical protein
MTDRLSDIAKRLNVPIDSVRALYEEMVQADTGREYAELAAQLNAEPPSAVTDTSAQVAQLNTQLAQKWGVTEDVVNQRLTQLNDVYTALPEAQRAQYESVDGIAGLWNVVNATSTPQPPTPAAPAAQQSNTAPEGMVSKSGGTLSGISPASLLTSNNRSAAFDFDTLVSMPEAEYAQLANSGQLLDAFNQGRVADTKLAVRAGAEQSSAISGQYMR